MDTARNGLNDSCGTDACKIYRIATPVKKRFAKIDNTRRKNNGNEAVGKNTPTNHF